MSSTSEEPWIKWFCSLRGNEFFTVVDEDYVQDKFNLTGLSEQVPHYHHALDMMLDIEPDDDFAHDPQRSDSIEQASEMLYGLVHARFVLTNRGIAQIVEKYKSGSFGHCHRYYCEKQPVLPVGLSDVPGECMVKLYCPKCQDVYNPRSQRHQHVDGAYFGTSLPHMLMMVHPELRPIRTQAKYTPRLYGFKLHPLALQLQHQAAGHSRTADHSRAVQMIKMGQQRDKMSVHK